MDAMAQNSPKGLFMETPIHTGAKKDIAGILEILREVIEMLDMDKRHWRTIGVILKNAGAGPEVLREFMDNYYLTSKMPDEIPDD